MLHVQYKEHKTHVSLHSMFVKAPDSVQKGLASYIRKASARLAPAIKAYIDANAQNLDHTPLVNPDKIVTTGKVYDLQALYNSINKRYFGGKLDLVITWYGEHNKKVREKCTLGQYLSAVKLVKIHRLLDSIKVPLHVIEYVIYHEMVHAVCPAYVDENGRNCIHSKEYKELEECFAEYAEANRWLETNYKNFFVSRKNR